VAARGGCTAGARAGPRLALQLRPVHMPTPAPAPLMHEPLICAARASAAPCARAPVPPADDAARFLDLRAAEAAPGGLLLLGLGAEEGPLPRCEDPGEAGTIMCRAMEGLIDEGAVSAAAAAAAALPLYARSGEEVDALVARAAGEWELLERRVEVVGHPAWGRYRAGGITPAQLANAYTAAWRAATEPTLARALAGALRRGAGGGGGAGAEGAAAALLSEYYRRIRAGLEARPGPLDSSTTYLLLRRR
jgi:hypothetical protein